MIILIVLILLVKSHNPYFNRWFSAITIKTYHLLDTDEVTILILIDGFLQYLKKLCIVRLNCNVTILILIDGFLQCELYI